MMAMKSASAVFVAFFLATTVSATTVLGKPQADVQQPVVLSKANAGQQAFLGKDAAKEGCMNPPKCEIHVKLMTEITFVSNEAEEVEEKAEKAETEAQEMQKTVQEVKAAVQEEAGEAAQQVAVAEDVQIAKKEEANEEVEIVDQKKVLKDEQKEATAVTSPEAKAVVKKFVDDAKKEVAVQETQEKMKEEKVEMAQTAQTVTTMSAQVSKAKVQGEMTEFQSEAKMAETAEVLYNPEAIHKVEVGAHQIKMEVLASKAEKLANPAAKATPAEELVAAEITKVDVVEKLVKTAKKEAATAKVEKEKAIKQMKVVVQEAGAESTSDQIAGMAGTVQVLKDSLDKKKCRPCALNAAFSKGPWVENKLHKKCSEKYGSKKWAQTACLNDPGCEWIQDWSCDDKNWRYCGKQDQQFSGDKKACSLNRKDGKYLDLHAATTTTTNTAAPLRSPRSAAAPVLTQDLPSSSSDDQDAECC